MTDQPPGDPEQPTSDDVDSLRREAASRRRALRDAEATIAAQAERIARYERREVEHLASERLANPADLLLVTEVDALRGEDGALDHDKVNAAIDHALRERPHWAKPEPEPPRALHPDLHAGPRSMPESEQTSFGRELKNVLRGG
jgi:hypothetical protein